jgi:dynein heavy chain
LTSEVIDAWNELFKLEKSTFKLIPHMYQVTSEIRKMYESFKPFLPVINDLRNPALKKRHLTKFKEFLPNLELDEDLQVPFQTLLKEGVMNFKEEIRDIAEIATKE